MNRVGGLAIAKGTECLLAVTLWKEYGAAPNWQALWRVFSAQPELSQIGTVVCVVLIVGIFLTTVRKVFELIVDAGRVCVRTWNGLTNRMASSDES